MLSEEKIREKLDAVIRFKEKRESQLYETTNSLYKKYIEREIEDCEKEIKLLREILNG